MGKFARSLHKDNCSGKRMKKTRYKRMIKNVFTVQCICVTPKCAKIQTPFVQAPSMWNLHILGGSKGHNCLESRENVHALSSREMLRVFVFEKITVRWARSCACQRNTVGCEFTHFRILRRGPATVHLHCSTVNNNVS